MSEANKALEWINSFKDANGNDLNPPLQNTIRTALTRLSELEWQPIETAPKDGSWVLVAYPCFLCGEKTDAMSVFIARWAPPFLWDSFTKVWISANDCTLIENYTPTHWMPLPSPPMERGGPK